APHLRGKESDRIAAMTQGLSAMGSKVRPLPDGLEIQGGPLHGALLDAHRDHRIHMAFAIAALAADGPSRITDPAAVATSYPGFHNVLARLARPPSAPMMLGKIATQIGALGGSIGAIDMVR